MLLKTRKKGGPQNDLNKYNQKRKKEKRCGGEREKRECLVIVRGIGSSYRQKPWVCIPGCAGIITIITQDWLVVKSGYCNNILQPAQKCDYLTIIMRSMVAYHHYGEGTALKAGRAQMEVVERWKRGRGGVDQWNRQGRRDHITHNTCIPNASSISFPMPSTSQRRIGQQTADSMLAPKWSYNTYSFILVPNYHRSLFIKTFFYWFMVLLSCC